jgi:flagellar biosynthesis/type III secretory pathway M-ring protein FliF/YscJ
MDVLRILIWVLGGLVIVMLVWRVVRLARLLERRIEEYDEKERSEVERNLFAELSELYSQEPPPRGDGKPRRS